MSEAEAQSAQSDRVAELGVRGSLRSLPAPPAIRLFEALTFILLFRAAIHTVGRLLLRYREEGELRLHPGELRLSSKKIVLGRTLATAERSFRLDQLQELSLEEKGEDARFAAGLGGLFLGTFLGAWVLTSAMTTFSGSLLIIASALLLLGVALDYLLGSGRSPSHQQASPRLVVVPPARGFVLLNVSLPEARVLLQSIQAQFGGQ